MIMRVNLPIVVLLWLFGSFIIARKVVVIVAYII